MVDAGLKINPNTDKMFTIEQVQDFAKKLKVAKHCGGVVDDEEAEQEFEKLFDWNVNDVRGYFQDMLHVCKTDCINPIVSCFKKCIRSCSSKN